VTEVAFRETAALTPAHSGGLEWKGEERSNDSVLRVKGGGKRGVRSEGGGDGVVAAGRRGERARQSRTPEVETPVDLMPTWREMEGGRGRSREVEGGRGRSGWRGVEGGGGGRARL
jgi:hypothetical protein